MKRFLAAVVLAAIAVTALAPASQAQSDSRIWPAKKAIELKFRTHANTFTANTAGIKSDFGNFDAVDSVSASGLGVASGSSPLDTTVAVSALEFWSPVTNGAGVVADSNSVFMTVVFADAGGTSSTQDSIYIATQASYDGKTWFTLATFLGGTAGTITSRLDQTNAAGVFFGRLNKLGASGGTPQWEWAYKHRPVFTTANDQTALYRYPYFRWITNFHMAVNYNIRGWVIPQYYTGTE